jgi:hypothetical protein
MNGVLRSGVAKARAADEARLNKGWALLHQATERCRLLDQRAAERREQARKEAEEIRASAAEEAEEVLANARESAREVLVRAHHEAMEIISEVRQRLPTIVGPPNLALAREEAKRRLSSSWTKPGPTPMASLPTQGRGWRKPRTARPSFMPARRARTPVRRA